MTPEQIAADIARGEFLKTRIEQDKSELKLIEKRLEAAGLAGPHVPLNDATREGKQRLLSGAGKILPIRFESDVLVGSFAHDSDLHKQILKVVAPDHFTALFKEVHTYEKRQDDGHKFRVLARKTLPDETLFYSLIDLLKSRDKKTGIVKSKTVIAWDDLSNSNPSES